MCGEIDVKRTEVAGVGLERLLMWTFDVYKHLCIAINCVWVYS